MLDRTQQQQGVRFSLKLEPPHSTNNSGWAQVRCYSDSAGSVHSQDTFLGQSRVVNGTSARKAHWAKVRDLARLGLQEDSWAQDLHALPPGEGRRAALPVGARPRTLTTGPRLHKRMMGLRGPRALLLHSGKCHPTQPTGMCPSFHCPQVCNPSQITSRTK